MERSTGTVRNRNGNYARVQGYVRIRRVGSPTNSASQNSFSDNSGTYIRQMVFLIIDNMLIIRLTVLAKDFLFQTLDLVMVEFKKDKMQKSDLELTDVKVDRQISGGLM